MFVVCLKIADLEDILCELEEFCVLSEIYFFKTRLKQIYENLRLDVYARMLWEPVYKVSFTLNVINNWKNRASYILVFQVFV